MIQNIPEFITNELRKLEKEKGIRILFAVECGSRAWGLESEDSDYDVRFVYVQKPERYFSLVSPTQVIELNFDEEGNKQSSAKGALIDMVGFDILKFGRLLNSSNPCAIEWLHSPTTYLGSIPEELVSYIKQWFNPLSLYHHYKSMCKQNYLKYIKTNDDTSYKKYLYALRGLINAKWVASSGRIPPIFFSTCLQATDVPEEIRFRLGEIIAHKKQGKEKTQIAGIPLFDTYIENSLKSDGDAPEPRRKTALSSHLDTFIQDEILEYKHET